MEAIRQNSEAFLIEASVKRGAGFCAGRSAARGIGGQSAVTRLLELGPRKIVIVACDPATLARDLAGLKGRYEIERLAMVDLFPQTFHIETIVA